MRSLSMLAKLVLTVLLCGAAAGGAAYWLAGADWRTLRGGGKSPLPLPQAGPTAPADQPTAPPVVDRTGLIEDGGLGLASLFSGSIRDPESLDEIRAMVGDRGPVGVAVFQAEVDARLGPNPPPDEVAHRGRMQRNLGLLLLYEGRFDEAGAAFAGALEKGRATGLDARAQAELVALRGVAALRRGEVDNCILCLGPSSCLLPIAPEAVHKRPDGSREAIGHFTEYLKIVPADLRVRWLLNLAFMTLGEHPAKVPPEYLIPLDRLGTAEGLGRFDNVAAAVGLTSRGPNQAGGSLFDDLNGDHHPDIFTTSLDAELGASLYVNNGDGTFDDRSTAAGLGEQVYGLNLARADYDNDGDLDVVVLRGGWEKPLRLSLLRNKGDATFDDVTLAAGLGTPIATEAAAWGDFDDDGLADLYVCGEYLSYTGVNTTTPDPRNRCRLYRNKGDGTFEDVAAAAGVTNDQCAKGAAWGDFDDDGDQDLFVSNMTGPCRLYRNQGDGTFEDVAAEYGVTGADRGFACWFFDYDNDGKLDLYVNNNGNGLAATAARALGQPPDRPSRPRLYRNLGDQGFRDLTVSARLDHVVSPMGCNFGDLDHDGFLDLYIGDGGMAYAELVPNLMFRNDGGRRFLDVTISSGTGHLQKGHGVSFADAEGDGDLDVFVEVGGGVPGDRGYNLLFRNPGHGRRWLQVKLVGTQTNRAALGAKLRAVGKGPDGQPRTIHRTIGNNSSFGGNTLVETLGLLDAKSLDSLEITWPTSRTTQTYRDLPADQLIVVTEGRDGFETIRRRPEPTAAAAEAD